MTATHKLQTFHASDRMLKATVDICRRGAFVDEESNNDAGRSAMIRNRLHRKFVSSATGNAKSKRKRVNDQIHVQIVTTNLQAHR